MELGAGVEFDRYRVESVLGEGGTAKVFLVRHTTLKTLRALKVLHVANKGLKERLMQEALILSAIEHPNIVRIIDALDIDGAPGVVMEYVNGPSLDRYLDESPPTADTAESIFLGILAGVECAHDAGIVHRDLKPANVLLSMEGGRPVPKVADFGIARVFGEGEEGGRRITKIGAAMGTPSYMAPEQIMDAASVDQRADIFALGCILYELLTGHLAFDAPNYMETFDAIRAGAYIPPEEHVPDLPDRSRLAIRACLDQDRERRPRDCAALRKLLGGSVITAVPVSASSSRIPRPSEPGVGRTRRSASQTFAVDPSLEIADRPRRRGIRPWMIGGAVVGVAAGLAGLLVAVGLAVGTAPAAPPVVTPAPAPVPAPAAPEPVAVAAPVSPTPVSPAPVSPAAVSPAAVSTPDPAPERERKAPVAAAPQAPVALGRIVVTGAGSYVIKDSKGAPQRGALPPGHYTVAASWGERSVSVGADVGTGETITVVCDEGFGECAVR